MQLHIIESVYIMYMDAWTHSGKRREPGGMGSKGVRRVGYNTVTFQCLQWEVLFGINKGADILLFLLVPSHRGQDAF